MAKGLSDNRVHLALVFAPITIIILLLVFIAYRDDPRTIEATKGEPDIEFTALPDSQSMYRMVNRRSGLRAYFTLSPDERLTRPIRVAPCDGFLPPWIPRFPNAQKTVCFVARTNLAEKKFSSFLVNVEAVVAAYEFYNKAMGDPTGFSQLANGTLPNDAGDIDSIVDYLDEKGGRRARMFYYRTSPQRQAAVAIEF